ncbi:MAG: hypothetical protein GY820_02925 [Gammaproteobacteria bacterium]|nr:hypothetical protein [Gammaproteobacteria bacterium]
MVISIVAWFGKQVDGGLFYQDSFGAGQAISIIEARLKKLETNSNSRTIEQGLCDCQPEPALPAHAD